MMESQADRVGASLTEPARAAYGAWLSPLSAADVARAAIRLSQTMYGPDGKTLYWLEGRPQEGGRQVLVRLDEHRQVQEINPAPMNVRTRAHEYGGGAFTVGLYQGRETVFYSNFADQRLYRQVLGERSEPVVVTSAGRMRYSDLVLDQNRDRLLCVVEDHTGIDDSLLPEIGEMAVEPINYLASVEPGAGGDAEAMMLTCGYDFFAFPRLSHDGKRLAYMAWKHPNMPWDESVLFTAEVGADGSLANHRKVAGGTDVSIFQPQWGKDGTLYFVSDESGYWQLKAIRDFFTMDVIDVSTEKFKNCEFGLPMWVFGQSTYAVVDDEIIAAVNLRGLWTLLRIKVRFEGEDGLGYVCHQQVEVISSPYSEFSYLTAGSGRVAMLAGAAGIANTVVEYDLATGQFQELCSSAPLSLDSGYLSSPEVIEFPTSGGRTAFAFYYPPTNKDFQSQESGQLPPLLVKCHGGPTGAASSLLSPALQYYTSRGFAVVDVNYGGSTGFGRAYRKRLNGNWGVVDVEDCTNAVKYLVGQGKVDGTRVAITGGSAGGFTVLCALTFTDVFKAGASHYGIGDLEALVRDTHKFESRYLDNLVGPYPFSKQVYQARSPIHHTEKLSCPVIFFQGLEDKVVPPNQAEAMVKALKAKNIPTVYIAYEGEQHGFRKAENIICTLESELAFFLSVFGIKHEHPIAPPAF
ncbi:MAG: prolyl oligopeptidase family serine peptidase [Candidatus Obscuribacter sp.]|nr:prolyl oligopeptidase family serine peptidase [Candidatus Obscuribacter sp.]